MNSVLASVLGTCGLVLSFWSIRTISTPALVPALVLTCGVFVASRLLLRTRGMIATAPPLMGYLTLFLATYRITWPEASLNPIVAAMLVTGVTASVAGTILWKVLADETRRTDGWVLVLITMGLLVAAFSGPIGGPGRMFFFLHHVLGLESVLAERLVLFVRKGIHVLFYGFFAYSALRFGRESQVAAGSATMFAFAWVCTHAIFDEARQALSEERTASFLDLLLDMTGALVVLSAFRIIGLRRTERRTSSSLETPPTSPEQRSSHAEVTLDQR